MSSIKDTRPSEEQVKEVLVENGPSDTFEIAVELSIDMGRVSVNKTEYTLREGDFSEDDSGRWHLNE